MLRSTSPAINRQVSKRCSLLATVVLSTLTLAACGGGGGGDSSPPPSSPSTPPPPPPPPTPTNTAPSVNAGADQTVTLPSNQVTLNGGATDAENNTLTYAWTSSPADGVTFSAASAAATQATFTTAGTYTLTLTANDGTTTGTDTVQVVVNARPILSGLVFPAPDDNSDTENHGWAAADPADLGMDVAQLESAEKYALTGGGSGIITRRGRIVRKWGDIDARVDLKSTTKSMGGIALALAIDENLLTLEDAARLKLPALGTAPNPPPNTVPNPAAELDKIKIWNLATHTAGFEKDRFPWARLTYQVGAEWSYSDGGLNWLSDLLSNVYQRDLKVLLNDRVWKPIGLQGTDIFWRNVATDEARPPIPGGITPRELASGISANPNAMARVGLLYLAKGSWNNTRIINETSVALASTPYPALSALTVAKDKEAIFPLATKNYGLLWWTNATKQLPDVPTDAYWAWGLGDSLIVVIPSLEIVVARVGTDPNPSAGPYWRSEPVVVNGETKIAPVWDGKYDILRDFLTPIAQSVKAN